MLVLLAADTFSFGSLWTETPEGALALVATNNRLMGHVPEVVPVCLWQQEATKEGP